MMHELPWITIFGHSWGDLPMIFTSDEVTSENRWFANDFHEWQSHHWKSLANNLTIDQKILIHGNECIILFLTRYFTSLTHHFATNNHRSLISPLSLRTVLSELTLWRHHDWSVTSDECDALALWPYFSIFLDAQIGTNAIFTSEW